MIPLLLLTTIFAAGEPPASQMDRPYQVKICVRFSADPIFTPVFVASVPRELRDQLRNFFGPLAEIEIVEQHPWLEKNDSQGVDALTVSADDFRASGIDEKLFVFDVDYQDGGYWISGRQLDGDVHYVGPVRTRTTVDRPWLAKALCLAVKDDFSPVAVVKPGADPARVTVEFRGSRTAGSDRLASLLGDGCVLQPFSVERKRERLVREPVAATILRMSGKGVTMARVESNLKQPWKQGASVCGFQAIRLRTTSQGRVRLQLLDAKTRAPLTSGWQVMAGDEGFNSLADANRLPAPDLSGYVVSPPLKHVAYVRVTQGGGKNVEFPVPLLNDWNELDCKLSVDKSAREKSDLARQKGYLMQDILALRAALSDANRRIKDLNSQKRYEEALREDELALEYAREFHPPIKLGIIRAEKASQELALAADAGLINITEAEKGVADLHQGLKKLAENLRKTIANNNALNRANVKKDLGDQELRQGNAEAAIANYEAALAEYPDQPKLKENLARLKEAWRIKTPQHQAARDFVFKKWSECEAPDIEDHLPEAERAVATLRDAGDYLSLKKLGTATDDHAEGVADLIEQLVERADAADQTEQKKYEAVLARIETFRQRVAEAEQQAIKAAGAATASGDDGDDAQSPPKPKSPPQEDELE